MTYTPTATPAVLSAGAGLGAGALLPATGATQINALAAAAAVALVVWAGYYFAIRKQLS